MAGNSARIALLVLATALPSAAKNVDLSTIPPREGVQLTIYNSEDLTLVRETRLVTFRKGLNPLQFSWANTQIDPTSVTLRFLTHEDELELLDTTYPHDKPQMLYWSVASEFDGDARIEVSYFTSGITWSADYVCISDPAEETMSFDGFVRVTNHSGEDYEDAQIRMVVGTINLVEKIQDLAARGLITRSEFDQAVRGRLVARQLGEPAAKAEILDKLQLGFAQAESAFGGGQIIKEGLSEYFIFTVEGKGTVPTGWSKRIRLFAGKEVPLRIQYRYRPAEYGEQLVRLFLLRNDTASDLGTSPLPDGVVRLFRDNGRDGLAFVVQQHTRYVPIGQEIELNLGPDPQIVHEQVMTKAWRDTFWFSRHGVSLYYSPTEGHRIEPNDSVSGWDERQLWEERIRNYRDKPIDVEIRRTFGGHVVFRSGLSPELFDYQTVQIAAQVPAGEEKKLAYELVYHRGTNEKQQNVTLEEGP